MEDRLYSEFLNPDAGFRGKPFWAWNGRLEKEELVRQIRIMKEMGFGGFFMHSRTGLATEYLGEEWFEFINACADEAEKLGLEAWLYDEDRWPSGIAGGMVTMEPRFRAKFICLEVLRRECFEWSDGIIAAFSCRLEDDFACYGYKRIYPETPAEAYESGTVLAFSAAEMDKSSFYNGYTYVDTLNIEATRRFIELTHEKYKKFCGDRLGRSIKGIFTDEPYRGPLMDDFGVSGRYGEWLAPWTYTIFGNFRSKYGYDLVECLPELFLKYEGKTVSQVKWHYVELLQEMFLENFAKPVHDWCRENNILLTGHILHEDSLTAQTAVSGSVMRYYEYMDYPGVDILTEGNQCFWVVKQLSSAARQTGKKRLLSEMYGGTGWQMSFKGHKAVGDWQALFGINLRCHHLSWFTMEGEAKRDFPASILHQSTWWREYTHVETYFSRLGLLMSQGRPCCSVLVVNPVESLWCQVYPGWSKELTACSPDVIKLENMYIQLSQWLCSSQIDFDYGDEDMLQRMYSVGTEEENKAVLNVGRASYNCVVVCGMLTIRSTTLKILKEFSEAGGAVIFAGDPPAFVDAKESDLACKTASGSLRILFERDNIVEACLKYADRRVEIVDGVTGKPFEKIFCQVREDDGNFIVMALNIDRKFRCDNAEVRVYRHGFVEEWDCTTGDRYAVRTEDMEGGMTFKTGFPPGGEHVYVVTGERNESLRRRPSFNIIDSSSCKGPFDFELDEPNVCVLDVAQFKIDNGDLQEEEEILKVDRIVRRRLGMELRGGEMIQPWFARKRNFEVKGKLKLKFSFHIRNIPQNTVELAMERPELFSVRLNGFPIDTAISSGWWVDRCIRRISMPLKLFREGENAIELETGFHQGVNLEAVYLLGGFGVKLEGGRKTIARLPQQLAIGDLTKQGLPFYSGKVRYILPINLKENKRDRILLSLGSFEAACVKVLSEEKKTGIIAWEPYEADITDYVGESSIIKLEVVLTRRNTFGPLHEIPPVVPAYGPDNFITEGRYFAKAYSLIPSGLLGEPRILTGADDL